MALLFDSSRVEEIERSVGLVLQFTTIIIIITPDFVIVLPVFYFILILCNYLLTYLGGPYTTKYKR